MAIMKTDLWVTVSTIACDPEDWVSNGLGDVLSRVAPTSFGLLM